MSTNTIHYRGDCTPISRDLLGPDMFGAYYRPTSAVYDAAADRTTVTLRPVAPADLQAIVDADIENTWDRIEDRMTVAELFGGEI